MKLQEAINIKTRLTERILLKKPFSDGHIVESFNSFTLNKYLVPNNIVGVAVTTDSIGESKIGVFSEMPIDDPIMVSESLDISTNDVIFHAVGKLYPFYFPFNPARVHRPAFPGVSIAHYKVTAGTLGAIVKDANGDEFILSNNHVLANGNDCKVGDSILQPGSSDGGESQDVIGYLHQFIPLNYFGLNKMDAALAKPINSTFIADKHPNAPLISGITQPRHGMKVAKIGRTTGITFGYIFFESGSANVNYARGPVVFEEQIHIWGYDEQQGTVPFSEPGDSGSLVFEWETGKAVGLLFGGSPAMSLATPIATVLDTLNVTLA
jgi:hypothetical protein